MCGNRGIRTKELETMQSIIDFLAAHIPLVGIGIVLVGSDPDGIIYRRAKIGNFVASTAIDATLALNELRSNASDIIHAGSITAIIASNSCTELLLIVSSSLWGNWNTQQTHMWGQP